jgi:predicted RNA-binding Zn-ribbon protein involved in translation (DUF1610 family)
MTENQRPILLCSSCGTDLVGEEIPVNIRHLYSPPYYWKRMIGLYDQSKDRTTHYQCPDCHFIWERDV